MRILTRLHGVGNRGAFGSGHKLRGGGGRGGGCRVVPSELCTCRGSKNKAQSYTFPRCFPTTVEVSPCSFNKTYVPVTPARTAALNECHSPGCAAMIGCLLSSIVGGGCQCLIAQTGADQLSFFLTEREVQLRMIISSVIEPWFYSCVVC